METLWLYDSEKHKRRAEKAVCLKCGKEYLRRLGNPQKQKHCSFKCGITEKGTSKNISVVCNYCGKTFLMAPSRYNAKKKKVFYCSPECGHKIVRKYVEKICSCCGKTYVGKTKYCSRLCNQNFKIKQYLSGEWNGCHKSGELAPLIKKYLIEKNGNKCSKCDWAERHPVTGNLILQTHHKDGDCRNNKEDNIEILCPNHHALTDNYGSLNKNSGRTNRKKYYSLGT